MGHIAVARWWRHCKHSGVVVIGRERDLKQFTWRKMACYREAGLESLGTVGIVLLQPLQLALTFGEADL